MIKSFNHYHVDTLHLEPTNVCNAACPQCAREIDKNFNKNNIENLTTDQIKNLFSEDFLKSLKKVYMCGVYGDPAAAENCMDIYKFFRHINPDITLGMNTNGSLRNRQWWAELGNLFSKSRDYVVFSIDGLADTNHIYRVNTVWDKIMANAQAFIDAGGLAHWDMLIYRHNEHQVEQCQELAKRMGFAWFRAKVSKRPLVSGLEKPVQWAQPKKSQGPIRCQSEYEHSLYVDAYGRVYPCCWQGHTSNTIDVFSNIRSSWNNDPDPVCEKTCRSDDEKHNIFTNQWQRIVEFGKD